MKSKIEKVWQYYKVVNNSMLVYLRIFFYETVDKKIEKQKKLQKE